MASDLSELLDEALDDLLQEAHEPADETVHEGAHQRKVSPAPSSSSSPPPVSKDESQVASTSSKHQHHQKQQHHKQRKQSKPLMPDEEEMDRFFATMSEQLKAELPKIDPNEAQARLNESVPQIFDLMQNLLSKELLYPALKDLAPKFDEWLAKNATSLSKEDKRRYKKQALKINEIIQVFDDESLDTQERFEKNLDLMEQMQSLGAPPDELTVPEGMTKCSIM